MIVFLHAVAGAIVLAEALNKLERTDPFEPGLCLRGRVVVWTKIIGWALLALGGMGALVSPVIGNPPPQPEDVMALGGFALLIVRSRINELVPSTR